MKLLRRFLILSHRYLGIPMSFLFVIWFASGIVMMYAGGLPALTPEQRLEHLSALDLSRVRLTPVEAAERAGFTATRATLLQVMQRPAYRLGGAGPMTTIFADDGEPLGEIDLEQAEAIAATFLDVAPEQVSYVRTVTDVDQWTLAQQGALPLLMFRVDDGAGTVVYVSPRTAEVTLLTTRKSRALAWFGTIPHWFYFTPLRVNQPLWYWSIVWASTLGCVLAVLGLALGVTQFRRSKPFRLSKSIRYTGWMRWHYLLGVFFGFFGLTWVFSGLLSMEPFAWTNARGLSVSPAAFTGGPIQLARFPAIDSSTWAPLLDGRALKEVEYTRIQDEPYFIARYTAETAAEEPKRERLHQPYELSGQAEPNRLLISASTLEPRHAPFSIESLITRLRAALPDDVTIVEQKLLDEYDAYYYSQGGQVPLPVLRVKLDDPGETWIYIDPGMSRVLGQLHRLERVERWLFNGLHDLDFSFWYYKRPLWDIGMIVLSVGALVLSSIGLCLGLKRLGRDLSRMAGRRKRAAR